MTRADDPSEVTVDWAHVSYDETSRMREVYGFAGTGGRVNVEGLRFRPLDRPSKTLLIYMHPATTLQLLPVPRAMARAGVHVLCAGSRYARNDTALIMENVAKDFGAYVRHAREVWGYEKVIAAGWSGGGSLAVFYQAQAERPTITQTPAGDPVDLGDLTPADALIFHAAHLSRAEVLKEFIDPSVLDETNPALRDPELDLYDPRNPNQPPYSPDYLAHFRAAQLARVRRRTALVREMLEDLKRHGDEVERGLVLHRTLADPRWLDGAIDPNDRRVGWCFLGEPKASNSSPAGVARFSTLRAWLSQWSLDDSNAHALNNAPALTVPVLAIENSADDAVPQPHTHKFLEVVGSRDKQFALIRGANHYYADQPSKLEEVINLTTDWLRERRLLE